MSRLILDITMSVDGYVAGPNPREEAPLGDGGMRLHEWVFGLAAWRRSQGMAGGEASRDSEIVEETQAAPGAIIMGRGMFGGGDGAWDASWEGYWGEDPPYGMPVFVLTHHARDPLVMKGGTTFTFVTDGLESALEQARAVAGGKDVALAGGANVVQQYVRRGLLDEFQVHVVPLLLGDGVGLFDHLGGEPIDLEIVRVVDSPAVTHLRYRIVR